MKLLILLSAILAIVIAEWSVPPMEEYMKLRTGCFESEGVPSAIVEKINKRQYDEDLGKEGRCFIKCLAVKTGTWDETNGYNVDRFLKMIDAMGSTVDPENARKCLQPNTENVDSCTWAFNNYACLWKNKYVIRKE